MNWICDASGFLTRNHCGPDWTPGLARSYQLAHLVIAISLLILGFSLLQLYARRKADLPDPPVFGLIAACLLLCGLSHLTDVVVFYWAPYRLFTVLVLATALSAALAATRLPAVVQMLLRLPTRAYVHKFHDALQDEARRCARLRDELTWKNAQLKARVQSLDQLLKTREWVLETNGAVEALNQALADLETLS